MNRRQARKALTRRRILQAARQQFAAQGFTQTTIRDIAQAAGVAVGTVFLHFPDKSALLAAALYEGVEAALQQARSQLQPDWPVREQLLFLAQALYTHNLANPALTRVLLKETMFMSGEWGAAFQEQSVRFVADVAALLAAAQERGELPPEADCTLLATSFFFHYFMVLINALREDDTDPAAQTAFLGQLLDLTLGAGG